MKALSLLPRSRFWKKTTRLESRMAAIFHWRAAFGTGSPREPRQEAAKAAGIRRGCSRKAGDSCRRRGPRACLGLRRRRKNSLLLGCQPTLVPPFCPSQFALQAEGEGGRWLFCAAEKRGALLPEQGNGARENRAQRRASPAQA